MNHTTVSFIHDIYPRDILNYSFYTTLFSLFFFNDPATTEIYTLSLHDALPISSKHRSSHPQISQAAERWRARIAGHLVEHATARSEEHTSELQSPYDLVCRLLLEKKKKNKKIKRNISQK